MHLFVSSTLEIGWEWVGVPQAQGEEGTWPSTGGRGILEALYSLCCDLSGQPFLHCSSPGTPRLLDRSKQCPPGLRSEELTACLCLLPRDTFVSVAPVCLCSCWDLPSKRRHSCYACQCLCTWVYVCAPWMTLLVVVLGEAVHK